MPLEPNAMNDPKFIVTAKTSDGAKTAVIDGSDWMKGLGGDAFLLENYDSNFENLLDEFIWSEHDDQSDVETLWNYVCEKEEQGVDIDVLLCTDTALVMPFIAHHMPKHHAWMVQWIQVLSSDKFEDSNHAE
jgi:hypothetical protein